MNVIDAKAVRFTYPSGKEAVRDVSFTIRAGEFFGFLGPNGAGKTTTIKMLATLLLPTRGRIVVNGFDTSVNPVAVRSSIGYTAQDTCVDPGLTAAENVRFACEAYRVPKPERRDRVRELLRLTDLETVADMPARTLSGGMLKRLDIATSLVHQPPLLFLDEPTTGLDPKARIRLWDHFRKLNLDGTTVFLTTQYLEEADKLCSRVAIINEGRIVAEGTPSELKAHVGGDVLEIHLEGGLAADAERACRLIKRSRVLKAPQEQVGSTPQGLVIVSPRTRRIGTDILLKLRKEGFTVVQFNVRSPTLEDVFLRITGEALANAQARENGTAAGVALTNGRRV